MIKTTRDFFLDIDHYQFNKYKQYVSGDVVLTHKIKEENRVVTCLSDGLGSGIKASVLANLTATMALKYTCQLCRCERDRRSHNGDPACLQGAKDKLFYLHHHRYQRFGACPRNRAWKPGLRFAAREVKFCRSPDPRCCSKNGATGKSIFRSSTSISGTGSSIFPMASARPAWDCPSIRSAGAGGT